jgi:hypothetical protein
MQQTLRTTCSRLAICLAILGGVSSFASYGYAQESRQLTDLSGYEPYNLRLGSFIMEPSLTVSEEYSDNIFYTEDDETSSFITRIIPAFAVQSDWSRHGILVEGQLERGYYHQSGADDYTDYYIAGTGHVDVNRSQRLTVDVGYAREHEGRGSDNLPGGIVKPVNYDQISARAQYDVQLNRFRVTPFAAINNIDFENVALSSGGVSFQDARDRTETGGGVEFGYEIQEGYEAYLRGTFDNVDYDQVVSGVVDRDSNGYGAVAGVNIALTRLLDAQFELGYQERDFDAPGLNDVDGLIANAALIWSVTPISEIEFAASRSIEETNVSGASSGFLTTAGVTGRYAVRRNVMLNATAAYAFEEFNGISREDETYSFGVGVDVTLNRYAIASASYRFTDENSNVDGEDYQANQFFLSGTVRY